MTRAITYKRVCHSSPLLRYCLAVMLLFPSVGKAVVEGIPCAPEPTDMIVGYGDVVNCRIDPVDDLDAFRFSGAGRWYECRRQGLVAKVCRVSRYLVLNSTSVRIRIR